MICFCATGDISSVRGTENDLRSDVRIGSKITSKSAESSGHRGINTIFCLRGPTGSRLAARFLPLLAYLFLSFYVLHTWSHLSIQMWNIKKHYK